MNFDSVTIGHEFRVYAMKRSGHHAVMSWLMAHFSGPVYFLNNCSFRHEELFSSTRVGTFSRACEFGGRVSVFLRDGTVVRRVEHLRKDTLLDRPRERLETLIRGERDTFAAIEFPTEWDAYVFNLEDFDLRHHAHVPFEAARRGHAAAVHDVLVLRDPYNWLASRLKGGFPVDRTVIDAWVSQCREALGQTSYLSDPLVVNYDRWFSEAEYRRELSARLGYAGPDPGIGETADFGGGSSFSGFEFRNRAEQMDVLNRWKVLRDDREYRELFREADELIELAGRYFPDGPRPEFLGRPAP